MTLKELNDAVHHVDDNEHYVIQVLNHKTGIVVGPAQLV